MGVRHSPEAKIMGTTSWRGQIDRTLKAIDHIEESKYQAKQDQDWQPGEAVTGVSATGTGTPSSLGPSRSRTGCASSILPSACSAKWIMK
jgi:hypothetical protein